MNKYKFRGLNHETGEWVYGYYTRLQEGARRFDAIISEDEEYNLTRYYIHDPTTIGQYTREKDKFGVEIYDGDICRITEPDEDSCMGREFEYIGYVVWGNGKWKFEDKVNRTLGAQDWTKYSNLGDWVAEFEVIGNIHQHPELVEK